MACADQPAGADPLHHPKTPQQSDRRDHAVLKHRFAPMLGVSEFEHRHSPPNAVETLRATGNGPDQGDRVEVVRVWALGACSQLLG